MLRERFRRVRFQAGVYLSYLQEVDILRTRQGLDEVYKAERGNEKMTRKLKIMRSFDRITEEGALNDNELIFVETDLGETLLVKINGCNFRVGDIINYKDILRL